MIIMVDNNFLIGMITDKHYYRLMIQVLEREELAIGIPTPVLAEFLVKDDNYERGLFLSKMTNFSQIYNFDTKSAQMSAEIMRDLINRDYFVHKSNDKQIIKVDIQILGITLANQIGQLYTTDIEISKIVALLNLPIQIIDFTKNQEMIGLPLFK